MIKEYFAYDCIAVIAFDTLSVLVIIRIINNSDIRKKTEETVCFFSLFYYVILI